MEYRIITFGLTKEQNELVKQNVSTSNYDLLDAADPNDLITIGPTALIINSTMLMQDSVEMSFDFYKEVCHCTDEIVVWLGE